MIQSVFSKQTRPMRLLLAHPHGFCAGVTRALDLLDHALTQYGPPVYARHAIVHNTHVIRHYEQKGVIFVDEPEQAPQHAVIVFSAHGAARDLYTRAQARQHTIIDATCPLVSKVHAEVRRAGQDGAAIILIGHAGHPEVQGTQGQTDAPLYLVQNIADIDTLPIALAHRPLYYVTQTTLSITDTAHLVSALQARFPHIRGPHKQDICYATENRQQIVKKLAAQVDFVMIIGSANSSNANRLVDIAQQQGVRTQRYDDVTELQAEDLTGCHTLGLSAGASTPANIIEQFIQQLRVYGVTTIDILGDPEQERHIHFMKPHYPVKKSTIASV